MQKPDLIIIGGSLGSIESLEIILKDLKNSKNISIVCIIHRLKNARSQLEKVLQSFNENLKIIEVEDKMKIEKVFFYLCPANYHVLINSDLNFSLDYSETVNFSRPSIDVLFESAADNFKGHILAILLSGSNKDGMKGCEKLFLKKHTIIVQSPESCENPLMTGSVFENKHYTLSLSPMEINVFLLNLLNT